jgi:hypothetical protein
VAPKAETTHIASFYTTPSLAWDLSNCISGETLLVEDAQVVDSDGHPVFIRCDDYGVMNDDYSAPMKAGSFTVRTTLSRLPLGWGLCDPESNAYQGWLWSASGGNFSATNQSTEIYVYSGRDQFYVQAGEVSWVAGGKAVTRTFDAVTSAGTSSSTRPLLASMMIPLCGPDPSTVSGQGWRNYWMPVYKLPAPSRWR